MGETDRSLQSESVKSYYDEWWENPSDIRNVVFDRLNRIVGERIKQRRFGPSLDLGTGKGRILSMLVSAGSIVTAVEFNADFVAQLEERFPEVTLVCADVRDWEPNEVYDLVTCIELTQVLTQEELGQLLKRLRPHTKRILVNISNRRSLHGIWVRIRRFQAPFIITYTSADLLRILEGTGYRVTYSAGVGFVTPLSLLRGFGVTIIGKRLAERFEKIDKCFPRLCHLFVVEAESMPGPVG